MSVNWFCKKYDELSLNEFHDIVAARIDVFVIEQDCPYQDLDGKDKEALHVFALNEQQKLLAYTRVLPQNISYKEVSIGRVITTEIARGKGLGHELMKKSMEQVIANFGAVDVRLSAQEHLQHYYGAHGFKKVSEMYLEDGIPHVEMLYKSIK
jgi:ElaA protein